MSTIVKDILSPSETPLKDKKIVIVTPRVDSSGTNALIDELKEAGAKVTLINYLQAEGNPDSEKITAAISAEKPDMVIMRKCGTREEDNLTTCKNVVTSTSRRHPNLPVLFVTLNEDGHNVDELKAVGAKNIGVGVAHEGDAKSEAERVTERASDIFSNQRKI